MLDDPAVLGRLEPLAGDAAFRDKLIAVRRQNKERLAAIIFEQLEVKVSPDALFDMQIKRIHEYKRQLLNMLEAVALYDAIRAHPNATGCRA